MLNLLELIKWLQFCKQYFQLQLVHENSCIGIQFSLEFVAALL